MTSTTLKVKVDRADASNLHDRLAVDIRRAIAEEEALPGERAAAGPTTSPPCSE